ncbi:23S rRNA (pseudouridine(1915)-N(3))-methyltransferase RlmH [Aerococcaceae bacterium DSM 111022]|nr:23S rRNA (pseudouridine(1915)-N(3))-methyltransferase RlmH [Aerococcaceae bacterium DSM 111022]
MNIEIISVGKLKEKYLKQGIQEYLKRLQSYAKVKVIEVSDEPTSENMSDHEIALHLEKEGERIKNHLTPDRKVIVMAIEGKIVSSEELAAKLNQYATYGDSKVTFIIGGSLGVSDEIKKNADMLMSFGRITLPHQLMRLVLTEQVYRAFRINAGQPYHK